MSLCHIFDKLVYSYSQWYSCERNISNRFFRNKKALRGPKERNNNKTVIIFDFNTRYTIFENLLPIHRMVIFRSPTTSTVYFFNPHDLSIAWILTLPLSDACAYITENNSVLPLHFFVRTTSEKSFRPRYKKPKINKNMCFIYIYI